MISIFAKPTFLNINPAEAFKDRTKPIPNGRGHLMRVSSMIRGDQIADQIGAKFNPEKGYKNDTCIYVKPMVRKGEDFTFEGKKNYIDIVDGHNLGELAKLHPEVGVIVCSKADEKTMKSCIPNEVVFIPQHHCNYNRLHRTRTGIKTVGVIGTAEAFPMLPEGLEEELNKRGIELLTFSRFFTRQDIIDFYMKIDVQLVWRPYHKTLSNPLKLVNASSFGIPTIALDEEAFKEMDGCYLPTETLHGFLGHLDDLCSVSGMYDDFKERCIARSEKYHIEKIGQLYKNLDKL
jgi:hypothetical protein